MKPSDAAIYKDLIREWSLGPIHVAIFRTWKIDYAYASPLHQLNLGWLAVTIVR